MNTRRVLITSWLQSAGGVETHLLNLARLLVERGVEVTVAARVCRKGVPLEGAAAAIPVTFLKTPFASDPRRLRLSNAWAIALWPMRFRARFDAILTSECSSFTNFLRFFLKPNGMLVGIHVGESPDAASANLAAKFYDALVVESPVQLCAFRSVVPADFPIAMAPSLGHYRNPTPRAARTGKPLRVAFVGRFDRLKGVHRLLELWPRLNVAPAELHFYGEGSQEAALRSAITANGLCDSVFLHGGWSQEAELAGIMAEIDLVVLPSGMEGLPVVLLEAMAYGVPFVASDVGAIRTLADGNPDVAVVPLEDVALRLAIENMAHGIRSGAIQPQRLQRYFNDRYSFEKTSRIWLDALLRPAEFWKRP